MKHTDLRAFFKTSRLFHVLAVFLLALAVRVTYLQEIRDNPFFHHLMVDESAYDQWARRIAAGEWLGTEVFYQDPLYPYFLGLIYSTVGRDFLWVRLIQLVIGSVTCALIYLLGRHFFDAATGLVAGTVAALYRPFFYFEGMFLKSFLGVFLVCVFLLLLVLARPRRSFMLWVGAGLVLGLLALVRANTLVLAGGVIVWLFLSGGGAERTKHKLIASAGFLAGLAIVVGSICARNYVVGEDIVLLTSQGGQNFLIGNNPWNISGRYQPPIFVRPNPRYEREDFLVRAEQVTGRRLKPSEASRYWFGEAFRFIKRQPRKWLNLLWLKTRLFWNWYEVPDNQNFYFFSRYSLLLRLPLPGFRLVAALALSGMVVCLPHWRKLLPLYLVVALYSATVIAFYVFARYRLPVLPPLIIFAAHVVVSTPRMLSQKKSLRLSLAVSLAVISFMLLGTDVNSNDYYGDAANARVRLGIVYQTDGKFDQAIAAYKKAIEILPYQWTAYNGLAQVHETRGQLDLALENYNLALTYNPGNPDIWERIAYIYYVKGQMERSAEYYREALRIKPDWSRPHYMLAVIYDLQGNHERAQTHLRKWRELKAMQ